MKILLSLFVLVHASSWCNTEFVRTLPNGHFEGRGTWSDNFNDESSYFVEVDIQDNVLKTHVLWGGLDFNVLMSFDFYADSLFKVIFEGKVVAYGYCAPNSCFYETFDSDKDFSFWERLDFEPHDNGLTLKKSGTKHLNGRIVDWDETLHGIPQ